MRAGAAREGLASDEVSDGGASKPACILPPCSGHGVDSRVEVAPPEGGRNAVVGTAASRCLRGKPQSASVSSVGAGAVVWAVGSIVR